MMNFKEVIALLCGSLMLMIVIPLVMYAVGLWSQSPAFLPATSWALGLGAVSCGGGIFLVVWSNYELWQRGNGGAAVIGKIKLMRESSHLVTTGPYALCRNPMHFGLFLYYVGCACAYNRLVCLIFPMLAGVCALLVAVYIDEPRLKRDFGREFAAYSAVVPRFIPKFKRLN